MDLQDQVVIITGASMGIGAATAREFAQASAKVVLAARSEAALVDLARDLGEARALAVSTDVTDRAQVDTLIQQALARFGRIDILVNNAGVGMAGPVATMSAADFEKIFAINVLGPLYAMQAAIPHLRKPGGGLIINVSSMVTRLTIPTIGAYRATKLALNALSDNARVELARDNIRVITVYPSQTASNFFKNTINASDPSGRPPGRGTPDTSEHVARRIVEGARSEPREVFMSRRLRAAALVGTLLPRLFERAIAGRMQGR